MTVLTFLPRFAPMVRDGQKLRTIRKERKRPIARGDKLSLRQWSARPYNSPQIVLRESVCAHVGAITLCPDVIHYDAPGTEIITLRNLHELDAFAVLDGFTDWPDMVAHFNKARGLPFSGVLIEWQP